jgi:hypothetical protein
MASSYTDLGIELMETGQDSGVWGAKTNTNLTLVNQAIGGYEAVSIAGGAQTTALAMTDATISNARNAVIEFTGTITGNQVVTIPNSIEKTYIIKNNTTGAFTVEFKTVSGTGYTFGASEKETRILFSNGTNVVDAGFSSAGIDAVVDDTSPQLGGDLDTNTFDIQFDDAKGIRDDSDNEQLIFQKTASAVNYIEVTNNSTGNRPKISVAGSDTNIGLSLATKGTGNIVAIGNFVPDENDTYDLGTSTVVWRNLYTGDLHLNNQHKNEGNRVDGTKGNWTLQEGKNDIFMINNISGEKFKINLSKIEGDL